MPEHETYDLDAAFARLERDITAISSAPGAGAAVARARRRRRTTIGGVAAATVLAVAGVAVAQGASHDSAGEPSSSLPTPSPLDAVALTAATGGWTPTWAATSAEKTQLLAPGPVEHCLEGSPVLSDAVDPVRGSGNLFFAAGDVSALATLIEFDAKSAGADRLWTSLTSTFAQCGAATPAGQLLWNGAESRSYDLVSATGKTEHFWVAREGSAVGLMWVSGAPSSVPSAADDGVMRAMVAALQFPGSYHDRPSTTSGASVSSSGSSVLLSSGDFAEALGAWQSGWSATRGADSGKPPCGVQVSRGASSGQGSSLGANGEQEKDGFETAGAARNALRSASDAFAACSSASYDVHTVQTTDGGSVTVATGTGADADVVWMVQSGAAIAFVAIPAGDTTPPDSVSSAVGTLLYDVLARPQTAQESANAPQQSTDSSTSSASSSSSSGSAP